MPNIYAADLQGKFRPKIQSYQFELKFSHFFCFRTELPFWGRFGPKSYNFQFKLKFGT